MPYITDLLAPDLTSLHSLRVRHYQGPMFEGREQPSSEQVGRLFTGFTLAVDKAIREYNAGRETLLAYSKSMNETKLFEEGLGRFETCLNTARRAFRFLDRLCSHRDAPAIDGPFGASFKVENLRPPLSETPSSISTITSWVAS